MKAKEFQQVSLEDLVSDDKKKEKWNILMQKYPNKDRNQIKITLSDEYMDKAKHVVRIEGHRSIAYMVRSILEDYLNRYDKAEE